MPVVLLVRHGQASFGADDYDVLSERGREQAALVGAALAGRGLRDPLVVCGTLRRQRDTARLLDLGEPEVDGRWDEYDHHQLLDRYQPGQTYESSRDMQVLLDRASTLWAQDPAGGFGPWRDGVLAALADAAGRGRDVVAATSAGVIAAIASELIGVGADAMVALNRVAVNGAVTKLVVGRGGTTLVSFNEHTCFEGPTAHLLTYR